MEYYPYHIGTMSFGIYTNLDPSSTEVPYFVKLTIGASLHRIKEPVLGEEFEEICDLKIAAVISSSVIIRVKICIESTTPRKVKVCR